MDQQGPHVGVIGLAVMGENLALNIARNGFPIAVYNRTTCAPTNISRSGRGHRTSPASPTLPELVAAL